MSHVAKKNESTVGREGGSKFATRQVSGKEDEWCGEKKRILVVTVRYGRPLRMRWRRSGRRPERERFRRVAAHGPGHSPLAHGPGQSHDIRAESVPTGSRAGGSVPPGTRAGSVPWLTGRVSTTYSLNSWRFAQTRRIWVTIWRGQAILPLLLQSHLPHCQPVYSSNFSPSTCPSRSPTYSPEITLWLQFRTQ